MRARDLIGAALVAAALFVTVPSAHAAPASIVGGVAGPDENLFSAGVYPHDAGTQATLTWAAGGTHNVTASALGPDGKPLFRSTDVSSGSTRVGGSQYVPVGAYAFSCTIHPGMNSSLDVNAGTPLPRPTIAVRLASKNLAKVAAKGKVSVKVTLSGGQPGSVKVRLGKTVLGTKAAAKSGTLPVALSKKGRTALEGRRKAKLKVEGAVDFGSPATASGKLS
jgi:plastocyanin